MIGKYQKLTEQWLMKQSLRERCIIFIAGFLIILFVWYQLLAKAAINEKMALLKKVEVTRSSAQAFQNNEDEFLRKLYKSHTTASKKTGDQKERFTFLTDRNLLINTMLSPVEKIKFISLQTKQDSGDTIQIQFIGQYFETLNYLNHMQKLPWCLSWDTLNYKVDKYPMATVSMELHIVKNI